MKKLANIISIIALGFILKSAGCGELSTYGPSSFHDMSLTDNTNYYYFEPSSAIIDSLIVRAQNSRIEDSIYKIKAPRNINKVTISHINTSGEPGSYTNKQVGHSVRVGVTDSITFHSKHGWNITYRFILEYEEETN